MCFKSLSVRYWRAWCLSLGSLTSQYAAYGNNPTDWQIVQEINRTDTVKSWSSTTSIDRNKMVWSYDYQITQMTATVNGFFGEVNVDITDGISTEDRMASGEMSVLPAVLFNDVIVESMSDTSMHILIDIDGNGLGQAVFSDIMLGSINVGVLGPRPIKRINIEALINVTGYDHGDFNRNGRVDAADYVVWRDQLSSNIPGYVAWRQNFGRTSVNLASGSIAGFALNQTSVPECASGLMALSSSCACVGYRRRRNYRNIGADAQADREEQFFND